MRQYDLVIPVYRPDSKLDQLLIRMLQQTIPPKKIILMNTVMPGFSCDVLRKRAEQSISECRIPGAGQISISIKAVKKEEFDHGGTRHLAVQYCDSEYVLFMTQDALPYDRKMAEKLLQSFDLQKTAVAYARQLANKEADEKERYQREFNYPPTSRIKTKADIKELGIKTFFCSDVCAMYDKKKYNMLGGFERRTIFNEDMIYAAKSIDSEFAIAYCADAKVIHSHSYSYPKDFQRSFDLGVSQKQHIAFFAQVSSEKEGILMVIKTAKHLAKKGEYLSVGDLLIQSAVRYAGYQAGIHYDLLPLKLRILFSMNRDYWKE